jgi:hypothetical protein
VIGGWRKLYKTSFRTERKCETETGLAQSMKEGRERGEENQTDEKREESNKNGKYEKCIRSFGQKIQKEEIGWKAYARISMALQPFCWTLTTQFRNPIQRRWDSLDGGSAHRKAATYVQNKRTHTSIP